MNRALVLALAIGCGLATVDAARAQTPADEYPQRTVTFLCPFPAGGGTDMLTRLLAQELQEKLKLRSSSTIVPAQARSSRRR
jgi:tripartite-type tricarboxylate transporter receptor subunit TctC